MGWARRDVFILESNRLTDDDVSDIYETISHEAATKLPDGDFDHATTTDPHVLIYGDPIGGFTTIGPVIPNTPQLDRFIDIELRATTWWLARLDSLDDT